MEFKFDIPSDLSEISLQAYQKYAELAEDAEPSEFLTQSMVAYLCGLRLSDVFVMKRKDVTETALHLDELFAKQPDLQLTFKVGKQEFGFIPNLDNITQGEYVDLDSYLNWKDMHKALAVLYRPIESKVGNEYTIQKYTGTEETAELMKLAPLSIALGARVFFYSLAKELGIATQRSLMEELVGESLALQPNSTKTGDGITQSMHSLKETLCDLMQ